MRSKSGFTLIELMTAIVLITILSSISFISFEDYISDSRDSTRIADMTNLKTSLKSYKQKAGDYPIPSNNFQIINSGSSNIEAVQGTLNENIIINNLVKIPKDPKNNTDYLYSNTINKQEFQIALTLENDGKPKALLDGDYKVVAKNMFPSLVLAMTSTGQVEVASGIVTNGSTGSLNRQYFIVDGGKYNLPYDLTDGIPVANGITVSFEDILTESGVTLGSQGNYRSCEDIVKGGKYIGPGEYQIVDSNGNISNINCYSEATADSTSFYMPSVLIVGQTGSITDNCNPHPGSYISSSGSIASISSNIITANKVGTITVTQSGGTCDDNSAKTLVIASEGSCSTPWGGTVSNGQSFTGYSSSSVISPSTCDSVAGTITCNDGELNGNEIVYSNESCSEIIGSCMGSIPLNGSGTATSEDGLNSWTYDITPGVCTFVCSTNYTWNGISCVANTQTYSCNAKPATGTSWNTVSSYTQTWDGFAWIPADDGTTEYNTTSSTTSCRYMCSTNYTWNGISCMPDTRTYSCNAKPDTGTSWNTVSSYTQTWNGVSWIPADDSTTEHNTTSSTTSCRFKCSTNYTWNGISCIANIRAASCTGLPAANASWNTVSSITQTWDGNAWTPTTVGTYDTTPSTTSCRFKCNDTYTWDGSVCLSSGTYTVAAGASCNPGDTLVSINYNGNSCNGGCGGTMCTIAAGVYGSPPTCDYNQGWDDGCDCGFDYVATCTTTEAYRTCFDN